jgi:nucleotide-binding universal stress UspA family protein
MFGRAVPDPNAVAGGISDRFAASSIPASVVAHRGPVAATIIQCARDQKTDILLLGSSQTGHLEFRGSGTTVDQVKNNVPCTVLVARHGRPSLVAAGIDGSEPGIEAAQLAARWAKALQVPLTLLVAEDVAKLPGLKGLPRKPVQGDAVQALLEWSRSHPDGLLVLGSRGLTNASLLHMGSVSDRVCLTASCSVLVVRPSQSAP